MDYKKDFPLLNEDIIYFDNSATSLKPISVVEEIKDYYLNYPANAHRGDYDISLKVNNLNTINNTKSGNKIPLLFVKIKSIESLNCFIFFDCLITSLLPFRTDAKLIFILSESIPKERESFKCIRIVCSIPASS